MSVITLLDRCRVAGVKLRAEAGKLRFAAPKGAMDEGLRRDLSSHKAEVLAALAVLPTWGELAAERWGPELGPDPLDRLEYQGLSPRGTHVWSDPDEPTLAEFDAAVPMAADWFLTPENTDRHRGDSPS